MCCHQLTYLLRRETEAHGCLRVQGQPGLRSEFQDTQGNPVLGVGMGVKLHDPKLKFWKLNDALIVTFQENTQLDPVKQQNAAFMYQRGWHLTQTAFTPIPCTAVSEGR